MSSSTSTTSSSGRNLPQFSTYKMKTSANGINWGAGGSIRQIKRGKIITAASNTTNRESNIISK